MIGHIALFVVVGGVMAVNAVLLAQMNNKVSTDKKAVEEAAKPAEIELTILTAPACAECYDVAQLTAPLKSEQVKLTKEETVEYTSDAGVELIKKYQVTRVPTVLVRGQTAKLFDAASFIQNLGTQAEDGTLVVTNVPAPYLEVASGAIKGKFTATYITDKACKECYDPQLHVRALAGLAMKPSTEKTVDRADEPGQALLNKYKITSTPTLVLTGDLEAYPRFGQVWEQVGTIEKDGAHIFRAGQPLMGAYHDLKTGKIVKPPESNQ